MTIKAAIHSVLRTFGYDIHLIQKRGLDPFSDMTEFVQTDNPTIFDVGANCGDTVSEFRSQFPGATIHAFEPSPSLCAQLRARCAHTRTQINAVAAGSRVETLPLQENTVSQLSSFLAQGETCWGDIVKKTEVPVIPLDTYCSEHGIRSIDILKCDTQGFDMEVLQGASDLFAKHAIQLLLIELTFSALYKHGVRAHEIIADLYGRGLDLVALYQLHDDKKTGLAGWTDALFVDRNFHSGNA